MNWPIIRFLALVFCLAFIGVALGYAVVTNPEWQIAEQRKPAIPTKASGRGS
jgi:hypothetical protein